MMENLFFAREIFLLHLNGVTVFQKSFRITEMEDYITHFTITRNLTDDLSITEGRFPGIRSDEALKKQVELELQKAQELGVIEGKIVVTKMEFPKFIGEGEKEEIRKQVIESSEHYRKLLKSDDVSVELREDALRNYTKLLLGHPDIFHEFAPFDGVLIKSGNDEQYIPLEVFHQIQDHLKADRKIQAIKVLREATRWGLKEAKEHVELDGIWQRKI